MVLAQRFLKHSTAALVLLIIFSSCGFPPYDEGLSVAILIFVMPYSVCRHDDREIYFRVCSIPTADIKDLN